LSFISNKNEKLSKYQACKYLNISRATFDNYVREGKIPKGRKQQGFKELFFYKKDLDKYLETLNK
jgi:excisionase family DNA binding protein